MNYKSSYVIYSVSCLNIDPYCAIGVNVADKYLNRMTASFYHVLKPNVKWLS
jgi:hypothetical protein